MQRVAELSEQAATLQQTVSGQRRQMGGLDAATKEENQVGRSPVRFSPFKDPWMQ